MKYIPDFKNLSLQRKLMVSYFLLIFFPLLIVGIFSYTIASSAVKLEVSRYISEVLQQVNDNIDNSLAELDRMTSIISYDPAVQEILQKNKNRPVREIVADDDLMNERINSVTNMRPQIEGLFIFSYNGEVYSYRGVNNSIKSDYIFTRTRWFTVMKSLNMKRFLLPTHVQDQVITAGHPRKVFSYIREIVDLNTRKPIGYILIDMNTNLFKNILNKLNVRKYQEFLIVDNNKTILYHTREENISTQFRSSYISNLLKMKIGNMTTLANNKPSLITFNTSSATNWTVISIIPVDILYKNIVKLEYIIIFMVISCMLLALFIAIIISRNITKPLSNLQGLMKKASSGNFNVRIPVETNDEIGELSQSFNSMVSKIEELIRKVYTTEILRKEAELNALQAQINPHFLYNTLQVMDIIAEDKGAEVISTVCQCLSKIFRYSINRGKEIVPLAEEIEHLQNYVYIQKIRFKNKFAIVYNIEPELYNYQIIKLILQPLVENALFHGVERKKGESIIKVSVKKIQQTLHLTVEDSGLGMEKEQLEALNKSLNDEILHAEIHGLGQRSIGLKNVNARIQLYFGDGYGVRVTSEHKVGTKVDVTIPAILYQNCEVGSSAQDLNR